MKYTYPTPPGAIPVIKKALNLESDEEACDLENVRKYYDLSVAKVPFPEVNKQDKEVEFNGHTVKISILRPLDSGDTVLPVILFMHGGGFAFGSYATHRMFTNQLVNLMPACIVFVDYTLSPEAKYPVALEESYAALCWVQKNADLIHVDANQLAVMGDSAGGNIATALTILAKQRGNTGISYQVLYYPMMDYDLTRDSYTEFKDDPQLDPSWSAYFWNQYLANPDDIKQITASPLRGSVEELEGLPPAFILTCERDVLRTEGELYAKKLKEAKVKVFAMRYVDTNHGILTGAAPRDETHAIVILTAELLNRHWKTSNSKI